MSPWDRGWHRLLVFMWIASILAIPTYVVPTAAERPKQVANVLVFSTSMRTSLINALRTDTDAINVTVITGEVLPSISLATFNKSLTFADVLFVDRFLPSDSSYLNLLECHVNGTFEHDGLVMFGFLQNGSVPGIGDFSASQVAAVAPLLPVNITTVYENSTANESATGFVIQATPATAVPENSTILRDCIPWSSCPLIDRRLLVSAKPGAATILTDGTGNETVLAEMPTGGNGSSSIFFSMEIAHYNIPFTTFRFFSYLMYVCTFHSMSNYSDALIESWEEWPFSPGYGDESPWLWIVIIIVLVGVTFWIHVRSRKSASHQVDKKGTSPSTSICPDGSDGVQGEGRKDAPTP